jgi:hypothetical protein
VQRRLAHIKSKCSRRKSAMQFGPEGRRMVAGAQGSPGDRGHRISLSAKTAPRRRREKPPQLHFALAALGDLRAQKNRRSLKNGGSQSVGTNLVLLFRSLAARASRRFLARCGAAGIAAALLLHAFAGGEAECGYGNNESQESDHGGCQVWFEISRWRRGNVDQGKVLSAAARKRRTGEIRRAFFRKSVVTYLPLCIPMSTGGGVEVVLEAQEARARAATARTRAERRAFMWIRWSRFDGYGCGV